MIVRLVELIPPGSAVSYGDIASITARTPYPVGPRQVGRALAGLGSADPSAPVPWWRVTNVRGELPAHLLPAAREHWAAEGMGTLPGRVGRGGSGRQMLSAESESPRHGADSELSPRGAGSEQPADGQRSELSPRRAGSKHPAHGQRSAPSQRRLDLRTHRADLTALADAFQPVLEQLFAEDAALRHAPDSPDSPCHAPDSPDPVHPRA